MKNSTPTWQKCNAPMTDAQKAEELELLRGELKRLAGEGAAAWGLDLEISFCDVLYSLFLD